MLRPCVAELCGGRLVKHLMTFAWAANKLVQEAALLDCRERNSGNMQRTNWRSSSVTRSPLHAGGICLWKSAQTATRSGVASCQAHPHTRPALLSRSGWHTVHWSEEIGAAAATAGSAADIDSSGYVARRKLPRPKKPQHTHVEQQQQQPEQETQQQVLQTAQEALLQQKQQWPGNPAIVHPRRWRQQQQQQQQQQQLRTEQPQEPEAWHVAQPNMQQQLPSSSKEITRLSPQLVSENPTAATGLYQGQLVDRQSASTIRAAEGAFGNVTAQLQLAAGGKSATTDQPTLKHAPAPRQTAVAPPYNRRGYLLHQIRTQHPGVTGQLGRGSVSAPDQLASAEASSVTGVQLEGQSDDTPCIVGEAATKDKEHNRGLGVKLRRFETKEEWAEARKGLLTASMLTDLTGRWNHIKRPAGKPVLQIQRWRDLTGIEEMEYSDEVLEKMNYGEAYELIAKATFQGLTPNLQLDATSHLLCVMQNKPQLKNSGYDDDDDFDVDGDGEGWLGASPDGLITVPARLSTPISLNVSTQGHDEATRVAAGQGTRLEQWLRSHIGSSLDGVLEIKVPHRYGPDGSARHDKKILESKEVPMANDSYMMQVQTQLELTDREWAVLYFWSEGLELGSRATLIRRDPKFFALVYKVAEAFRKHVESAKRELLRYSKDDPSRRSVEHYLERKHERHVMGDKADLKELTDMSEKMIQQAPSLTFSHEETQKAAKLGSRILAIDLAAEREAAVKFIEDKKAQRMMNKLEGSGNFSEVNSP